MTDQTFTRAAFAAPNSYDPATRTVSAVVATATPVMRRDARGPFAEVLTASTLNVDVSRDTPLLDSHRTDTVRAVIGRVVYLGIESEAVVATLKLSNAEDVTPITQRIEDGSLTGVSIGYRVAAWSERNGAQGRTKSPVSWSITEVTLTSSPADKSARLRHDNRSSEMAEDLIETVEPDVLETQRRVDLRHLARNAGVPAETCDGWIDSGVSLNEAKGHAFDHVQTRARTAPVIRAHVSSNDDPATIRERQADALFTRMAGGNPQPESHQFLGMSLLDMARDSLARAGVSVRAMSPDETFTRANEHTTSDFPLLVSNAANKSALASYRAAASPLKMLGRQRSLSNFKTATAIRLGELGRLEPLTESGEITATSRAENGETMRLTTYARNINVSRQLLIDDDLGMLGDMTSAFGEAAAQTEADVLVDLILSNPNLSDGTPVFHTSRGNIAGSGTSLGSAGNTAALEAARKAMRVTKGLDGKTLVNVTPKYLLVGPELESAAERLLASIFPATTDDVNVFGSKLSLLVEPRIEGEEWFVFSDPARLAALQYGYLSSAQGVQIQRAESWNTLGMKFRAFLDFGAGWLDGRAAYKNSGDA